MCGISGYYCVNRTFEKKDLVAVTQALSHRGPDAEGYFIHEGIGLGHKRLSIIDLSESANQPMHSHDERYVMVYNGEVYNYKELSKELNISFRTSSDSEVILEAFVKHGPDFVHKLNGMFSIAILDKEKKELFIFRDRLGIKPLYYYHHEGRFAFASETKALLKLDIDKSIHLEAVKDYFFLEYIPSDLSVFRYIKKLEPGSYIKFSPKGFEKKKYYDVVEKFMPSEDIGEARTIQLFEEKLAASVRYQSISDVPIGAFLSGGTDSSLICALFQQQNSASINTFTIGFDVPGFDESGYAGEVAALLKTNHSLSWVKEKEFGEIIPELVNSYDEPFAAPSTIPSLMVCKRGREKVTVALSGDGGDELFMGYGYYQWHTRIQKLNQLGGYPLRKLTAWMLSTLGSNTQKRAARVLNYPNFRTEWLHIWSQEQYMFTEAEISSLFNEKYTHTSTLNSWERIQKLPAHPFEKISLFDIENYLPCNLLYKMDIASMASGLEVRVPYLDHNLVEFSINLPLKYKVQGTEQKVLMKKVLEKYLPERLVHRKKWGFPSPVGKWLETDHAYLIDRYLAEQVVRKQGIFNFGVIDSMVREFKGGRHYHFKRIWSLLVFQMWYKKYMDPDLC